MNFWVLELGPCGSEKLESWQARILPVLLGQMPALKKWTKAGSQCFLHVQTVSPMTMFPALFQSELLKALSQINCVLEHGVDTGERKKR